MPDNILLASVTIYALWALTALWSWNIFVLDQGTVSIWIIYTDTVPA